MNTLTSSNTSKYNKSLSSKSNKKPSTSTCASQIMQSKAKDKQNMKNSLSPNKIVNADGQEPEEERVIMPKKQLIEFTKKFAISKLDFEEEIQKLKSQLESKTKMIGVLEEQVDELRNDQYCMQSIIEKLKIRHLDEMKNLTEKMEIELKEKQDQIRYLQEDSRKLREWLEQQKIQSKRSLEFLKIKDQIISNLEWELKKYKLSSNKVDSLNKTNGHISIARNNHFLPSYASCTKSKQSTSANKESRSKKIIIKRKNDGIITPRKNTQRQCNLSSNFTSRDTKTDLIMFQERVRALEEVNQQLVASNKKLKDEVQFLKQRCSLPVRNKKGEQQLQISKKMQETAEQREKMLVAKCLYLQRHIEKLTRCQQQKHEESVVLQKMCSNKILFHRFVNNDSAISQEIEQF